MNLAPGRKGLMKKSWTSQERVRPPESSKEVGEVVFASNDKIFYTQGGTIYHKGTGMGSHRTWGGFGPVPWEQSWDLTSQQNVACLLVGPHGLHVSHSPSMLTHTLATALRAQSHVSHSPHLTLPPAGLTPSHTFKYLENEQLATPGQSPIPGRCT